MSMVFNHGKLEERIKKVFGDVVAFGKMLELNNRETKSRLKGETEFSMIEIDKAAKLLNISPEEIPAYFFEI